MMSSALPKDPIVGKRYQGPVHHSVPPLPSFYDGWEILQHNEPDPREFDFKTCRLWTPPEDAFAAGAELGAVLDHASARDEIFATACAIEKFLKDKNLLDSGFLAPGVERYIAMGTIYADSDGVACVRYLYVRSSQVRSNFARLAMPLQKTDAFVVRAR